MKHLDDHDPQVIEQKLNQSIKKYIKLRRKRNSIDNEMETLERDIQKYKISYQNVS